MNCALYPLNGTLGEFPAWMMALYQAAKMEVEAPSAEQKHFSDIENAARELAEGQSEVSVRGRMKQKGVPQAIIDVSWDRIRQQAQILKGKNHRRNLVRGLVWFSAGSALVGGFVYHVVTALTFPWLLLFGLVPMSYGWHLLRLKPHERSKIREPRIFGRNL